MKPGWVSRLAPPSSIPKNSAWLLAAFVAQKGCALVIFVLLARHLGTAGFGSLAFILAFGAILAQGTELGVSVVLVRRVAVARAQSGALLGTALAVKGVTSLAALGLGLLVVPFLGRDGAIGLPAMLVLTAGLTEQLSRTVSAVFVGHERMEFEAVFLAARAATMLLLVTATVVAGGELVAVTAAFCLTEIALLCLVLVLYRGRFRGAPLACRMDLVGPLLKEALPVGGAAALGIAYLYLDKVLLWTIRGPEQAGVYDAAYRVLTALTVIPMIAGRAVYPVLSRTYEPDGAEARMVLAKVSKALLVLGLPIAVGGPIVAARFMVLLYGEAYRGGATPLAMILVAVGLIFLSWVPKTALLAAKRGRDFLVVSAVTTAANLAGDLTLIPWLGATGAAASTVLSEVLALALVLRYAARMFPGLSVPRGLVLKAVGATALMVLVVVSFDTRAVLVQILIAAAAYTIAVAALRLLDIRDIRALAALRPSAAATPPGEA